MIVKFATERADNFPVLDGSTSIRGDMTMNVKTGDVVELDVNGEAVTALVLLATPEAVILDPCDGTMPLVFRPEHLGEVRVFDPAV